jgi:hypothetical protein
MMKQTGVAQGSAKQIAKSLSGMMQNGQQDKVMKLAEEGIDRMAKKMKNAPATFEQLVQSLQDVRENLFEALGQPMLDAIVPQLQEFKKYIVEHKEEIEKYAKAMGVTVGKWITMAAEKIKEGFAYLQTHADEIQAAITKGFEMAKSVVEFILAHKEEIAIAFGVKAVAPMVGSAVSATKGALDFGGALAGGGGLAGAGILASTAALAAFAAAITSVGYAAYKGVELYNQVEKDNKMNNDARLTHAREMAMVTRQLTAEEQHHLDVARKSGVEELGGEAGAKFGAEFDKALSGRAERMDTIRKIDNSTESGDTSPFVAAYNAAAKAGDTQMLQVLKEDLEHSAALQTLMANAADGIDGGLAKMSDVLGINESARERLMMFADKPDKPDATKLIANFSGPITLKQDFRDQDPDRVAIVFRRDMERAASSLLQARGVHGNGV